MRSATKHNVSSIGRRRHRCCSPDRPRQQPAQHPTDRVVLHSLAGQRMRLLGGEGPEVAMVPCSAAEALDRADNQFDALLDAG